ncbi:MAG: hypothetical protein JXB45_07190 [Candidatus Krumholzibacteriota bacterium]|nr:hypothetical protein [Candidatus Krumholzibacteriota bacterium]
MGLTHLLHNHEDFEVRQDCPACQWKALSQEDYFPSSELLETIRDPLNEIHIQNNASSEIFILEGHSFSLSSRAPPRAA